MSLEFWQDSRKTYVDALLDKMQAPDGSYHEGLIVPGVESLPKTNQTPVKNLGAKITPEPRHRGMSARRWFPLPTDYGSEESVDRLVCFRRPSENYSRKTSNARTSSISSPDSFPLNFFRFPDVGYFRDPEVQSDLTNILFIYSLQNPVLGYRQGMHELLALLYYACDFDSISEEQAARLKSRELGDLLSRAWVTADAYTLFLAVMRGVGRWYEWREHPASSGSLPPGTS
jgi:TBC1 domain family protein 5